MVIIVILVSLFSLGISFYNGKTFEPEIKCIDGYQYEEEWDGDLEPITDIMGRKQPCQE